MDNKYLNNMFLYKKMLFDYMIFNGAVIEVGNINETDVIPTYETKYALISNLYSILSSLSDLNMNNVFVGIDFVKDNNKQYGFIPNQEIEISYIDNEPYGFISCYYQEEEMHDKDIKDVTKEALNIIEQCSIKIGYRNEIVVLKKEIINQNKFFNNFLKISFI